MNAKTHLFVDDVVQVKMDNGLLLEESVFVNDIFYV